jgi:hypothetical protein
MAALHPRYWSVRAENPVELVILLLTQWRHLLQSTLLYWSGLVLLSPFLLPQAFAAETSSARMLPMLHFSSTAEEQQLSRYGGVGTIGEDPFGQLWLASRNGLLHYDGQQIRRLSAQNSGLANNLITDLDTQDPEALWLLTYNLQLQQMRYADQQFRTLDLSTQLITGSFNVARLFGTRDRIWLLGGHRLRYVDRATMQLTEIGPSLAAVVNRYARVSHTDEAAPDLWMLTDQGQLYHWAEQQQQLSPVLQLPTAEPAEAMLAVDDKLYVLQHKKLYQLDPAQRTWHLLLDTQTLDASAHPFYLLHHQLRCIGPSLLSAASSTTTLAEWPGYRPDPLPVDQWHQPPIRQRAGADAWLAGQPHQRIAYRQFAKSVGRYSQLRFESGRLTPS